MHCPATTNTIQLRINIPIKNLSKLMKYSILMGNQSQSKDSQKYKTTKLDNHRLQDKPSDAVAESVALNNTNKNTDSVSSLDNEDVIAINAGNDKESLQICTEQAFDLTSTVKQAYQKDKLYSKILKKLKAHAMFGCKDSLVFTKNLLKQDILCIPCEAFIKGRCQPHSKWVNDVSR